MQRICDFYHATPTRCHAVNIKVSPLPPLSVQVSQQVCLGFWDELGKLAAPRISRLGLNQMPFTFKQFHIADDKCGMPVSTDGVLLGAWAPLTDSKKILDIGAGSGLLSLMAAQRTQRESDKVSSDESKDNERDDAECQVTAIEIDDAAVIACQENFSTSPWSSRLKLIKGDIDQLVTQATMDDTGVILGAYDHIICNPPYFETGPLAQNQARANARHTHNLDFQTLQTCIRQLLAPEGFASLILPVAEASTFIALLKQNRLQLIQTTQVSTVEGKAPRRTLLLLAHEVMTLSDAQEIDLTHLAKSLFIRDKQGQYSQAMISLTEAFYLKM